MIAGFTGSRNGMSEKQCQELREKFIEFKITELHHGCCKGADKQAHIIARNIGLIIIGHPGLKMYLSDIVLDCDRTWRQKPFLDRNRDIVDDSEILFVGPDGPEKIRSGTWATKRYAQKVNKPFYILEL